MSLPTLIETTAAVLAIVSFLGTGLWRVHKALNRIDAHTRQLTPNGGSHLADAIRRTETQVGKAVRISGKSAYRLGRLEDTTRRDRGRQTAAIDGLRDVLAGHITHAAHFDQLVRDVLAEHGITVPDPDTTED